METLDYKMIVALSAATIAFFNLIYYFMSVFKGQVKPHMYTWLIWVSVTAIAAAGQLSDSGGFGAYLTALMAFNCLAIAILAYFKGEKNITRADKICLISCVIAIAVWPVFKSPLISVVIVTIIDCVGFIPTIRKSFYKPYEENLGSFSIYILTFSMAAFALEKYSLTTLLYPLAIAFTSLSLVTMLIIRRRQLGHKILA